MGSSTSETPAAFGLTVARNLGCRFIVSVSRLPLPSHNRVKYLTVSSGERRRRRSVLREVRGTTRRQRLSNKRSMPPVSAAACACILERAGDKFLDTLRPVGAAAARLALRRSMVSGRGGAPRAMPRASRMAVSRSGGLRTVPFDTVPLRCVSAVLGPRALCARSDAAPGRGQRAASARPARRGGVTVQFA